MSDFTLNGRVATWPPGTLHRLSVAAWVSGTGALGSLGLLTLCALEYGGIVHTDLSWFVVDQLKNGEACFNSNGDIHGDWGNMAFAVLAAPALVCTYLAAAIAGIRGGANRI